MRSFLALAPLAALLSLPGCSDSTSTPAVPPASSKTTSSSEAQVDRTGAPVVPHVQKPSTSQGSTDRMGNPTR